MSKRMQYQLLVNSYPVLAGSKAIVMAAYRAFVSFNRFRPSGCPELSVVVAFTPNDDFKILDFGGFEDV